MLIGETKWHPQSTSDKEETGVLLWEWLKWNLYSQASLEHIADLIHSGQSILEWLCFKTFTEFQCLSLNGALISLDWNLITVCLDRKL